MYAHLDRTIGTLLEPTRRRWSARNQYVVALSADHGVTEIPEQLQGRRAATAADSTRARLTDVLERRDRSWRSAPAATWRASAATTSTSRRASTPGSPRTGAIDGVVTTLAAQPGVARVYRSEELRQQPRVATDPLLRAAALSYVPGRSGDLVIVAQARVDVQRRRHDARQRQLRRSARADSAVRPRHQAGTLSRSR